MYKNTALERLPTAIKIQTLDDYVKIFIRTWERTVDTICKPKSCSFKLANYKHNKIMAILDSYETILTNEKQLLYQNYNSFLLVTDAHMNSNNN
jgi:hypothetical protein